MIDHNHHNHGDRHYIHHSHGDRHYIHHSHGDRHHNHGDRHHNHGDRHYVLIIIWYLRQMVFFAGTVFLKYLPTMNNII